MKKLINSRKVLFLLAGIFISVFLLIYLNACPDVNGLNADPDPIYEKEKTTLSFTADWSAEGCLPWDSFHTIKWRYKKDNEQNWTEEEFKLEEDGVEVVGTSAPGSFVVYASTESDGYVEGDHHLEGVGEYEIEVWAWGEKDDNSGWGKVGQTTLSVKKYIDLEIENVVEADEFDDGRLILLNNDDDNENDTEDMDDAGFEDDDLVKLSIDICEDYADSGTLTLDITSGKNKIKIWDNKSKDNEIDVPDDTTWDLEMYTPPDHVYVEGVELSELREIVFCLTYEGDSGTEEDKVRADVNDFTLEPVQSHRIGSSTPEQSTLHQITGKGKNAIKDPGLALNQSQDSEGLVSEQLLYDEEEKKYYCMSGTRKIGDLYIPTFIVVRHKPDADNKEEPNIKSRRWFLPVHGQGDFQCSLDGAISSIAGMITSLMGQGGINGNQIAALSELAYNVLDSIDEDKWEQYRVAFVHHPGEKKIELKTELERGEKEGVEESITFNLIEAGFDYTEDKHWHEDESEDQKTKWFFSGNYYTGSTNKKFKYRLKGILADKVEDIKLKIEKNNTTLYEEELEFTSEWEKSNFTGRLSNDTFLDPNENSFTAVLVVKLEGFTVPVRIKKQFEVRARRVWLRDLEFCVDGEPYGLIALADVTNDVKEGEEMSTDPDSDAVVLNLTWPNKTLVQAYNYSTCRGKLVSIGHGDFTDREGNVTYGGIQLPTGSIYAGFGEGTNYQDHQPYQINLLKLIGINIYLNHCFSGNPSSFGEGPSVAKTLADAHPEEASGSVFGYRGVFEYILNVGIISNESWIPATKKDVLSEDERRFYHNVLSNKLESYIPDMNTILTQYQANPRLVEEAVYTLRLIERISNWIDHRIKTKFGKNITTTSIDVIVTIEAEVSYEEGAEQRYDF